MAAENNVVFTNNTTKVLYPKEQHFWSGTPVTAPGSIPAGSTAQGKQKAAENGALKFATVYVDSEEELPTTRKFISAFDIAGPQEYGPYGTDSPNNYSITFGEDEILKEVFVRHESIVQAVGFIIADKTGATHPKLICSGGSYKDEERIILEPGEYITQISGTYGDYKHPIGDYVVISTININTNIKQYGPFGSGEGVENTRNFASPVGKVIGFFGSCTWLYNIISIGVYHSAITDASKAYAESGPIGPIDWNVVEVKLGMSSKPDVEYVDQILGGKVQSTVTTNFDATVVISDS